MQPSKPVTQLNAELEVAKQASEQRREAILDLRSQLRAKDKDIEDIQRSHRTQIESLRQQLDELRQLVPVASADLETLRDRILNQLKLGKQAPLYKTAKQALDQLIAELRKQ